MNSFWHCFVGEKNDYYTLFIVLLFFEFGITQKTQSFDWVFCVLLISRVI
ncbi:hypothetical protein BSPWISOX_295 [uncultured Gammaproteobacteria bacterium]|nr:hypothetical protein BSPWISOX_295 [uncultured Gammaproteobacteria bacterium]